MFISDPDLIRIRPKVSAPYGSRSATLPKMSGIGSATLPIEVLCKRSCSCLLIEMFYTVNSEGLLCRSYCKDCGSKNIGDLTLLTHSCSQERLEYIFRFPASELITIIVFEETMLLDFLSGCFHRSVSPHSPIEFCHIGFLPRFFNFKSSLLV